MRRRYALWVVICCREELAFVGQWREAREKISAWVRRRGSRGRFVALRVVCNPDFYGSVEKVLREGAADFPTGFCLHVVLTVGEGRIGRELSIAVRSPVTKSAGAPNHLATEAIFGATP